MALSQFKASLPKSGKFNDLLYNRLIELIGEPMLIDDQSTFAYWYHPATKDDVRYHTVSLDSTGIHCSVQTIYNIDHAKLLLKTTRRAWYEPGKELLTVTGGSLEECNAILTVVLMLIEKKIHSNEFEYFINKKLSPPDYVISRKISEISDEATPGRPVGPNGPIKGKQQATLPPLKTYTNKKSN